MVIFCDHPIGHSLYTDGIIFQGCLWKTVFNVYPDRLHSITVFGSMTWIPGPIHLSNVESQTHGLF
jgi:hypothetical protein